MFFVVDVETSGLTPWTGQLLSVAIVPVTQEGEVLLDSVFYERLMHTVRDPREIPEDVLTDTNRFWLDQPDDVISEAFSKYPRVHPIDCRTYIKRWVEEIEPDKSQRFIAANPSAFDKMWLESLYGQEYDSMWPFHYRSLCLRSFRFGLELSETVFGSRKGAQESAIPHHAREDAIAEALDLSYLIELKRSMNDEIASFKYIESND